MATNVLVIPEDFRRDQYVLKPIVEKMFAEIGVKAFVQICKDPLLGGVGEALKWDRLEQIFKAYQGMTHIFLLLLDRDCDEHRLSKLEGLENRAGQYLRSTSVLIAQDAWQEIEVWVLAGLDPLLLAAPWKAIRAECHPKETYFDKVVESRGLLDVPYQGRDRLAREASKNYVRIRQLCPEDVGRLEQRIKVALERPK